MLFVWELNIFYMIQFPIAVRTSDRTSIRVQSYPVHGARVANVEFLPADFLNQSAKKQRDDATGQDA